MRQWILIACLVSIASFLGANHVEAAGVSLGQRKAIASVNAAVQQAGVSFAAADFAAAGENIREAIKQVEAASEEGSPEVFDLLLPAMKRISKAHTMLEFEGVSLPPFRIPGRPAETPTEPNPAKPKMEAPVKTTTPKPVVPTAAPENGISFTNTVAPILANRCGGCHIKGSKGNFSLATFATLMKGPPEGVVIFAGDTVGSRLIETIESGDMPRGGGKVAPNELKVLKDWIIAGAKFDGTDPTAPIVGSSTPPGAAPTMNEDALAVRKSTGSETVSFAKDIAPILVNNCNGCHVDAMQVRGGLRMDTFALLFRGGDSGRVIEPGKSDASLLVKKIRGMEGDRMPAGGRPALPEESIRLISTWINEGATLDGASEDQPLRVMSQLAWAASASTGEMSERRHELALTNMKLANASRAPVAEKITEHFFVFGTASQPTIDLVAQLAEEQMKTVATVVMSDLGEGFYKGRATIFVSSRRYDYSEFAKMVEGRSLPTDWTSHWRFDGIDAYVSLVATDRDEKEVIASRLLSPLTSLAVATRGGDVPRWLAEGVGTATAARKRGADKDERRKLESEIMQAITVMGDAKKFLDGKLTPEQTDRIGAAISTSLLDRTHRRNFDKCLRLLGEGKSFEKAFGESFGVSTQAFVESWIQWVRG